MEIFNKKEGNEEWEIKEVNEEEEESPPANILQ
jgi:hypothetical protein